ncbi:MAG: hypothetical protein MZV64_32190 [Ignavibacteriales bacterium]|nr:hypothetical protein [Ignavibacteriales bacterium]
MGKEADIKIMLRFGIPAIVGAFIGAELMIRLSDLSPLFSYYLFGKELFVFPIKLIIAALMIILCAYGNHSVFKRN